MKKIQKSKKGFTLVEMVLVIAIIVILAAVLLFTVSKYLNAANAAKQSIEEHNSSIDEVTSAVSSVFT
ncbi:MAG: type II secretion system protein [Clostridiales bacterium]|jgi:type IV pilus assembly protein PilA|nr:type II secretion system protein [Clostridiales bacterium]